MSIYRKIDPIDFTKFFYDNPSLTSTQIAQHYGVACSCVTRWRKKLNLKREREILTEARQRQLKYEEIEARRANRQIYDEVYLEKHSKLRTVIDSVDKLRDISAQIDFVSKTMLQRLTEEAKVKGPVRFTSEELSMMDMLLKAGREARATVKIVLLFQREIRADYENKVFQESVLRCIDDVSPELAARIINEIKFNRKSRIPGEGEEFRFITGGDISQTIASPEPVPAEVTDNIDGEQD